MSTTTILPTVPSHLIRLALADLAAIEADPSYTVNMLVWHQPKADGQCIVCLAGSVIAKTLETPANQMVFMPEIFDDNRPALEALDSFRVGAITLGVKMLDLPDAECDKAVCLELRRFDHNIRITPYAEDRASFKRDLATLADDLEGIGL